MSRKRAKQKIVRPYNELFEKLVAPEDADGTAEGGELDFGEAVADSADKALCIFRGAATNTVGIRLEKGFHAIVHCAGSGLRVQVKGIRAREAYLNEPATALH